MQADGFSAPRQKIDGKSGESRTIWLSDAVVIILTTALQSSLLSCPTCFLIMHHSQPNQKMEAAK